MRYMSIIVVVCMLATHSTINAQSSERSLRSRAKAEGGEVRSLIFADFSSYSVAELARRAEVVVHGRVTDVKPHLTPDESTVVTDFTIATHRVLKETMSVGRRAQPGPTAPLIVRHLGGTVTEGNLKMSTHVTAFPSDDALTPGEDVVVFLVFDPKERVFELADGPYAAFRVKEGRVHYMTKEADRQTGHVPQPLATFLADVERQVRER